MVCRTTIKRNNAKLTGLNYFSDDVPANNTIWVLGDNILTDAAGHYNYFKKNKDTKGLETLTNQLYMENMYAIRIVSPGIYTARQAKNTPNIILNMLVDTLNTKAKVPHTLVILMNDYRFWNNRDLLATYQMERIIHRFLKEIRRIIEARNLSLPPRAVNWDYPRIFISQALPLPNNMSKPYPKGFKANRSEYNQLLQREEAQLNYQSVNMSAFSSENGNNLFSEDGAITQKGFRTIWTTISDAIHKSDNQNRINANKAKAKQLAAQMASATSEATHSVRQLSDADDESEINNMDGCRKKKTKLTKRALLDEFNSSHRQTNTSKSLQDSPNSEISEYFTAHHNNQYDRSEYTAKHGTHTGHRKLCNDCYHHKPAYRGKHKNKRPSNWRNQNPNRH